MVNLIMDQPTAHFAAVLAIGTEVVSGQIINGNAAKISQYLAQAGAEVVLHETVADERAAIIKALDHCEKTASILIVTGGLGPTTDDFTRNVIAEWVRLPLEFHEPSWLKIVSRLEKRGIPIAESNRRQCDFPRGSQVLANAEGTADGFYFTKGALHAWVLPGPPNEIDAIWKGPADLETMVRAVLPPGQVRFKLFTWDCLGKSESELGEIVEKALEGSGLQTGYRLHRPYIEVKVWVKPDEASLTEATTWFERLEDAIAPWLAARQGEDIGRDWVARIKSLQALDTEIEILDACTGGLLAERVGALLRQAENRELSAHVAMATEWKTPRSPKQYVSTTLQSADSGVLTLTLAGISANGDWSIGLRNGAQIIQLEMTSPYRGAKSQVITQVQVIDDRLRTYVVETALKKWSEWILSAN